MKVLFAYYGLSCAERHSPGRLLIYMDQYRSTEWAASMCDGKDLCYGKVSTKNLEDPYYGCPKNFVVVAKCDDGEVVASLVRPEADHHIFRLDCHPRV